MSLLTSFFKREPRQAKGVMTSFSNLGIVPGYGAKHVTRTDTASLQRTMTINELVFACLQVKAVAMMDPRLIVEKKVGGEYVEQPDHPVRALLMSPNPEMSESDLMAAALISWDTTNPRLFFCEIEREGLLPIALWPLDPSRMQPKRGHDRSIIGYNFVCDDGSLEFFALDELLIRRAPAWYKPSPSVVVARSVESDQGQTDYVRDFFANGGMPSVFIKDTSRSLNQPQRDQARQAWQQIYSNISGGQHGIGVLDMHQDVIKIGAGLDELDSESLRMISESRICMAFGVPPLIVYAYVGLMRSTYSNLKEAWASFWDATMSPALKEWRDFWVRSLLMLYEDPKDVRTEVYRLRYDLSQVAALQDDVDAVQTRSVKAYTAGLLTLNEARQKIGEKPDPTPLGDEYRKAVAPQSPQTAQDAPDATEPT